MLQRWTRNHYKTGEEKAEEVHIILSGSNLYSLSLIRKIKTVQDKLFCTSYSANHELMLMAKPDHTATSKTAVETPETYDPV